MPQKHRMTISLSRDSVRFLRSFRTETKVPSMSALFEKIVADLQGKVEMQQLDKKIAAYYDALPEAAMQEEAAWGAMGEATLALEAESEEQQQEPHQPKPQLALASR
jgi:hypothetical protein